MSREQIEEMAKVLNECCNRYDENGNFLGNKCSNCEYWCDTNHLCCSYCEKEAIAFYNAGYRKQSEVAREILEEIETQLDTFDGSWVNTVITTQYLVAELKKKYTER